MKTAEARSFWRLWCIDPQSATPDHLRFTRNRVLDRSDDTSSLCLINGWFTTRQSIHHAFYVEKAKFILIRYYFQWFSIYIYYFLISPSFSFSIGTRDCGLVSLSESVARKTRVSDFNFTLSRSPTWCKHGVACRADRAWLMSAISRLALEGRLDILNNNQGYEVAEG